MNFKKVFDLIREEKARENGAELAKEFEKIKNDIRLKNYLNVMSTEFVPETLKELRKANIEATLKIVAEIAHNKFIKEKNNGKFDDLNIRKD